MEFQTKQGLAVVERWGRRWNVRFPNTGGWIPFPSRKQALAWVERNS